MTESYVELHAHSAFSLLEGASVPEELAGACAEFGMPAMALVDHHSLVARRMGHRSQRWRALPHLLRAARLVRRRQL